MLNRGMFIHNILSYIYSYSGMGRIIWNVVLYSTNMTVITMLVCTVIMYPWYYYVLLSGLSVSDTYTDTIYEILPSARDFHQIQTSRTRDNGTNRCRSSNIRFCASYERQMFIQIIQQLERLLFDVISPIDISTRSIGGSFQ